MRLPALLRRRSVVVPTLAGWATLAGCLAAATALTARALPGFLAVDEPVRGGLLVVEGWLPATALDAGAQEARGGRYQAVVVTGGPIREAQWNGGFATYAERAGAYLRGRDLGGLEVAVVPAPASDRDRTWEAARAVRRWIDGSGRRITQADVLTYGPHARRSRDLYRRALGPGVAVGARAVPPLDYELTAWWRRSEGAREVIGEAIGYGWMLCCFSPPRERAVSTGPAPAKGGGAPRSGDAHMDEGVR